MNKFLNIIAPSAALVLILAPSLYAQSAQSAQNVQNPPSTPAAQGAQAANVVATPPTMPLPPPDPSKGIGFPTPQAALDALRKRTDVDIKVQNKWLVIRDGASKAIWTFAPPDHPAYPAVIKRVIVQTDNHERIETSALCQAKRAACDQLMKEMRLVDEKMRESVQKSTPPALASPAVPVVRSAPLASTPPPSLAPSDPTPPPVVLPVRPVDSTKKPTIVEK